MPLGKQRNNACWTSCKKIEDQEEFEKLLTASYAAWGGQHGTVKLTEEGLKEFIKLIKENQKK